jgi:hypothetical protein
MPKRAQKNMINYSGATPGDQPSDQAAPKRPRAKLCHRLVVNRTPKLWAGSALAFQEAALEQPDLDTLS